MRAAQRVLYFNSFGLTYGVAVENCGLKYVCLVLSGLEFSYSFSYKNLFYRNVEAEIDPDFKNTLRTYPT